MLVVGAGSVVIAEPASAREGLAWAQSAALTGVDWRQRTSPKAPPGGFEPGLVYDSVNNQTIAFGGGWTNQTWSWNGRKWSKLHPSTRPAVRRDFGMAYDPVRDETVLYGGWDGDGQVLGSTWVFKNGQWSQRSPAKSAGDLAYQQMAYDPTRQQIIMFGGIRDIGDWNESTWAWDGKTWTELAPTHSPAARAKAAFAYDPLRDALVMFGGEGRDDYYDETWVWNGTDWFQPVLKNKPPALIDVAGATFNAHLAIFGGERLDQTTSADTWILGRDSWRLLDVNPAPSARSGANMAWDPVQQEDVLLGPGPDTWTLHR